MIDVKKFICSLMKFTPVSKEVKYLINCSLKDQGLEYKDGKIVKVEPKFKKGDWVVYCHEDVDLITGIKENGYTINEGGFIPFACEDSMQLWDISLARDGDVLADSLGVILFKKIGNEKHADVVDYHGYTNEIIFEKQEGFEYWGDVIDSALHPATKEQRDLLFQKMKEAGYEWDAENKQLKKIEPKEEPTEFEKGVKATLEQMLGYPVTDECVALCAAQLLLVAKKQLQEEFDKQLEQAYKNADKVQYRHGYRKAIEDAREWLTWYTGDREVTLDRFDDEMEQKLKELSQG